MVDPMGVLEQSIEEEVERRVAERLRDARAAAIAAFDKTISDEVAASPEDGAPLSERITRTDATRLFGITTSRMRSLESRGLVHPRRRGGRIMVDPEEVAKALGVAVPGQAPNVEEYLAKRK